MAKPPFDAGPADELTLDQSRSGPAVPVTEQITLVQPRSAPAADHTPAQPADSTFRPARPATDSSRSRAAWRGQFATYFAPFGSLPGGEDEVRRLLRLRLAWIFTSAVVPVVVYGSLGWAGLLPCFEPLTHGVGLAVQAVGGVCFVASVASFLLSAGADLSRLRRCEVASYAVFCLYAAYVQYASVSACEPAGGFEGTGHARSETLVTVLLNQLVWFITVLQYGLLVPSTWRRCGAMCLAVAAANCGSVWAAAWHVPAAQAHGPLLMTMVVALMVVASGIALFGSYKISTLQREAADARQEAKALGQYRLKELLGVGGMGKVFRAEHRLLKRSVAIKVIRPERASDPALSERFRREVEAMTSLTHFNVVEVYDYGQADDGSFYYVMEYLPGLNLEDLVRRYGPLPPARAAYLLRQVCSALAEAHGKGLVHRDLKPSNVVLCERGGQHDVVKLLDFGLVRRADLDDYDDGVTQHGSMLGTPAYMAPEQADDAEAATAASDLYSLGAMAHFLLTGRPPFSRLTWVQTLAAHRSEPPAAPSAVCPGVPPEFDGLVLRCLAKTPDGRPASAGEVEATLAGWEWAGQWGPAEAARWWEAVKEAEAESGETERWT